MLEQVEIDGKKATCAFLDEDFNPVEKTSPDLRLIKVIFEDGETMFIAINPGHSS